MTLRVWTVGHSARTADAFLCAEATVSRCHRRFVADALVRRGVEVLHVLGPRAVRRHVGAAGPDASRAPPGKI